MGFVPDNRETGPAPGESLHPALALANSRRNTADGPIGELASAVSLRAWLAAHRFEGVRASHADDVRAFAQLRDAVRELLLARIEGRVPQKTALALVNDAAAAAASAPQLRWPATGPEQSRDPVGARGSTLAQALIAADAIELVAGEDQDDLRACAAPGCVRLLLRDHPRRTWCSVRCGDRVRASRYYRRHRATSPLSAQQSADAHSP